MALFTRGRRRALTGALGVALLALLALGVTQAFAGAPASTALPIYKDHDDCAAPAKRKTIGTASVSVKDGTITATISVKAKAEGPYEILLYDNLCEEVADLGKVNQGSTKTVVYTGAEGSYFLDLVGSTDNETPWFKT